MLLEYKNLKIRNAGESDAKQLAVWWNDGRVMAHAGFRYYRRKSVGGNRQRQ